LDAYCMKCKEKREISDPIADFNAANAPVTHGVCGVCGTKVYRVGRTPAHEGMAPPEKKKRSNKRKGKLVIVESPAKARTVGRYLGKGYTVKASVGHVRDLLRSSLSVDVENHFAPKYRVPNEKRSVVKELKKLAKQAETVYLATDPDREGEAIAWHLMEAAEIEPDISRRVVFHEITKPAVTEAFINSRNIDMHLVDAQQARRVLDRLVGYSISPILWQKVRSRLSAGRVQSVALRLVVEKERAIEDFIPKEYWTIEAVLKPEGSKSTFTVRLVRLDGVEPDLPEESVVQALLDDMLDAQYRISKIKHGERRRNPYAPYITSTLQQDAARRLGYTAKRTMALAQQLYEGLDTGDKGGAVGLITYMRTDSTHISGVAQKEVRDYILNTYGKDYLPDSAPVYRTRAKSAQEAHEAIRPTSTLRLPAQMKAHLTRDQYRLYKLIWQRFVASQMESAVFDTVVVEVGAQTEQHAYLLRASGSTLRFAGFLSVYEVTPDENQNNEKNITIPPEVTEGQVQTLERLIPEQHFTQPPPRYSEATLVQELEENGIGRPSTYAPTLSTIQQRGYVARENKRLFPTETGCLVNDLLVEHFSEVVNLQFTASMEEDLDQIAVGDRKWVDVVQTFYDKFEPQLARAQKEIPTQKAELEKIGRQCPKCERDLVIRWGRFGKFISCSGFPECRHTEPWLEKIGVPCPDCDGEIVQRKSRKGRVFYGCVNYPECQFTSWKRPISPPCPNCGGLLVISNKREVMCLKCEETFLIEKFENILTESV